MASGKILLALAFITIGAHPALADGLTNGLPQTSMDSFVYEAGPNAEMIYGDESIPIGSGIYTLPAGVSPTPIAGFNQVDRINSGIFGTRAAGLTTGHGSYMPDASGRDEFVNGGPEFSMSGNQAGAQPPGASFDTQLPISSVYGNVNLNFTGPLNGIPISGIPGAVASFPGLSQMFPSFTAVDNVVSDVTNVVNTAENVANTVSNLADDAGF
jgi:hypothetical protein